MRYSARTYPLGLLAVLLGVLAILPARPQAGAVTLAFLGDVMLARGVARAHAEGGWEGALADLAPCLAGADLRLANLESPLTDAPAQTAGYDLRAPPEAARALSAAGLDLLATANNHALDGGPQGAADTRRVLLAAGLAPIEPGYAPVRRQVNGVRLAFFAFDDVSAPLDTARAARAVAAARQAGDAVVVSVHWGLEHQAGPSGRQEAIAQALAGAGASVVWGHHPHVLQPVRWVQGAGRGQPALVAYSLGNALFDQIAPKNTRAGAVLLVRLDRRGVQSAQIAPFWIDARGGRAGECGRWNAE